MDSREISFRVSQKVSDVILFQIFLEIFFFVLLFFKTYKFHGFQLFFKLSNFLFMEHPMNLRCATPGSPRISVRKSHPGSGRLWQREHRAGQGRSIGQALWKKRKIKLINTVRDGSPPSIGPPRGPSQPIVQSEWSNGYWNRHAAQAGGKLGGCKFSSFRGLASKQRWWGSLLVVVGFGENCWFLFENCLAESWKKTLFKNGSFWNVRYLVFPFR